jgi:hypothetical protein
MQTKRLYIDAVIDQWLRNAIVGIKIGEQSLQTTLFAGDQAVCSDSEAVTDVHETT